MSGFDYKSAGVDIGLGDDVSKVLYEAARQTWRNREGRLGELVVPFDDFSGVRAIDVSNLPSGTLMNIGFDGVGTKMELAERVGDHSTIAYDLFAMVCDDAVVRGAEPVLIGSILDVNRLGDKAGPYLDQIRQLAQGYVNAARDANVAIVNGEVAELGSRVGGFGPFNYNWGASVVWFANRDRMFTGHEVKPGDALVGLREEGFRSNGLSLVRKVLSSVYGDDWHNYDVSGNSDPSHSMAFQVLSPSKIYSAAVVDMFGGFADEPKVDIHGVAHITGGGIPGKVGRMLKPSGLGAAIDEPFSPSPIMGHVKELGDVSDREAYQTWNMGQGMVIATPNPEGVMNVASAHSIESKVIGEVTPFPGISIRDSSVSGSDEYLQFNGG